VYRIGIPSRVLSIIFIQICLFFCVESSVPFLLKSMYWKRQWLASLSERMADWCLKPYSSQCGLQLPSTHEEDYLDFNSFGEFQHNLLLAHLHIVSGGRGEDYQQSLVSVVVVCGLSGSVTLHSGPAGGGLQAVSPAQARLWRHAASSLIIAPRLHGGPVMLRPVRVTPCFECWWVKTVENRSCMRNWCLPCSLCIRWQLLCLNHQPCY